MKTLEVVVVLQRCGGSSREAGIGPRALSSDFADPTSKFSPKSQSLRTRSLDPKQGQPSVWLLLPCWLLVARSHRPRPTASNPVLMLLPGFLAALYSLKTELDRRLVGLSLALAAWLEE